MSNHVKILARCDFSLRRRQRRKTYLPWHPLLAIGSSFSHHHWPENGIAYCELPSEPSLSLYNHLSITEKEASVCLQHVSLSQQIDQNRREDHIIGQQQQQLSMIEWTWVTFEMPLWLSPSVLRRVGGQCYHLRGWCALRLSLTAYHTAKCFLRRVIHTFRQ